MDVGKNTALGDGHRAQELVQLLVVADGKLDVSGDNAVLLVVLGGIACQLKDLGSQVLKNRGKVDGGSASNALGVSALPQEAANTADWELKTSLGASGHRFSRGLSSSCLATLGGGSGCFWCCYFGHFINFLSNLCFSPSTKRESVTRRPDRENAQVEIL